MTDLIAADFGIRQLYARFTDAVWRLDGDDFADCFAEDGEWKIATMHMKGRAEIRGMFDKLLGACERVQIIIGHPILEVGEGTAVGRLNVTEIVKMRDGSSAMTLGTYFDRYVETGGRWLYQWRHFGLHYRGPIDLSADVVDSPFYGRFPTMPGQDDPTFTRRKFD